MFPNMRGALKGWTKRKTVISYSETTVDFETVLTANDPVTARVNYQPTPPQRVDKKPEEDRQWIWWDIWVDSSLKLKIKDWIVIDDKNFQAMAIHDWKVSGFYHYECVEAFMPSTA